MTPRQKELARHALGLDGERTQSYRNRFVASRAHANYIQWAAMVEDGHAKSRPCIGTFEAGVLFWLTQAGAELALLPGERLDPEDFPDAKEPAHADR